MNYSFYIAILDFITVDKRTNERRKPIKYHNMLCRTTRNIWRFVCQCCVIDWSIEVGKLFDARHDVKTDARYSDIGLSLHWIFDASLGIVFWRQFYRVKKMKNFITAITCPTSANDIMVSCGQKIWSLVCWSWASDWRYEVPISAFWRQTWRQKSMPDMASGFPSTEYYSMPDKLYTCNHMPNFSNQYYRAMWTEHNEASRTSASCGSLGHRRECEHQGWLQRPPDLWTLYRQIPTGRFHLPKLFNCLQQDILLAFWRQTWRQNQCQTQTCSIGISQHRSIDYTQSIAHLRQNIMKLDRT